MKQILTAYNNLHKTLKYENESCIKDSSETHKHNYSKVKAQISISETCKDVKKLCDTLKNILQDKEQKNQNMFAKYMFLVENFEKETEKLKNKAKIEKICDIYEIQSNKININKNKIESIQKSIALAENALLLYQSFLKKGTENEMCYVCKKGFCGNDKENYCKSLKNIISQIPKTIDNKKIHLVDLQKEYENDATNETKNKEINEMKIKIINIIEEIESCKKQHCNNLKTDQNHEQAFENNKCDRKEPDNAVLKKYKPDTNLSVNDCNTKNEIKITDYIKSSRDYKNNRKYIDSIAMIDALLLQINKYENLYELFCAIKIETTKITRKPELIAQEIKNLRNEIEKNKIFANANNEGKNILDFETIKNDCIAEKEKLREKFIEQQKQIENNEFEIKKIKSEIEDIKKEKYKQKTKLENYKKNCLGIINEMKEIKNDGETIKEKIERSKNDIKLIYEKLEQKIINSNVNQNDTQKILESLNKYENILQTKMEEINEKMKNLYTKNEQCKQNIEKIKNVQKKHKDDVKIQMLHKELNKLEKHDINIIKNDLNKYENILSKMLYRKAMLEGEKKQLEKSICDNKNQLKEDYNEIVSKYTRCYIEIKTLEIVLEDIDKCIKALDRSIVDFHSGKIEEVNTILKELWLNTYKGNDIDYIKLKSETNDNKVYNYKVVMYKNNVELEMRGRCSAGQKVLASILMRLALSDAFTKNCSVMALDEPTTNLDKENIESLAYTLKNIINKRKNNQNFQFILITHDKDFVEIMCRDECEYFYQIKRNENGDSEISKQTVY